MSPQLNVIGMPLFLAIWNWERQYWWGSGPLVIGEILMFILFVFIGFEYVIPNFDTRYTADNWDGVAYLLGGLIYWRLAKEELT